MEVPKIRLCPDCGSELVKGARVQSLYRRTVKWECPNSECHLMSVEWRYKKRNYRIFDVAIMREAVGIINEC